MQPEVTEGWLFFPVTPFTPRGEVDLPMLVAHVGDYTDYPLRACFAAGGTGEFLSLSAREVGAVVGAVREALPTTLLYGTAGGPLGHARECAVRSRGEGADRLLVMPPTLAADGAEGFVRYVEEVLSAAGLPALVYNRPEAPVPSDAITRLIQNPHFLGFKDGVGDLGFIDSVRTAIGQVGHADVALVNGRPLAEMHYEEYAQHGVHTYTSSLFTMAPDLAEAYRAARREGRHDEADAMIDTLLRPLEELRMTTPGHGVAMVKAGVRLGGREVGAVRAPLTDLTPECLDRLDDVLTRARASYVQ